MPLRILCIAIIACFFACSKTSHYVEPVGSVSFTAHGITYNWLEVNDDSKEEYLTMSIYGSGSGAYHFNITNEYSFHLHPLRMVYLTFLTNSLAENTPYTYTNTSPADPSYPPHEISVANVAVYDPVHYYSGYAVGDFATVTITKLHDQRADGTFSGRMTRMSDSTSISITNGVFKNVPVQP